MFHALIAITCTSLLFFNLGCTHQTRSTKKALNASPSALSLAVIANRHLEIETCGCAVSQKGGVDRQWNVLDKWRKENKGALYFFEVGTTFSPIREQLPFVSKPQRKIKAAYLIKAFNAMGMTALALSADDTSMGIEELIQLGREANFPILTTNLYQKGKKRPLFQPYVTIDKGDYSIVIFGVTSPPNRIYKTPSNIEVRDSVTSIKRILNTLPQKNRIVVVLTNQSYKERVALLKAIPEINIAMGGDTATYDKHVEALNGSQLLVHPELQGRVMASLSFLPKWPLTGFHNPDRAKMLSGHRNSWKYVLNETERRLAKEQLSPEKRMQLQEKVMRLRGHLKRTEPIPLQASSQTIHYEEAFVHTTEEYQSPKNAMTNLLAQYHATIRNLAVANKK